MNHLKTLFFSILLLAGLLVGQVEGADLYVTQSGTGDGTAVGTPDSIADFSAGNGEFAWTKP